MQINKINKNGLIFLDISNNLGFSITLCDLGASIYSVIFDNKEMTFVPESILDFAKENAYYGKTIGRLTGRHNKDIIIDEKTYSLIPNEGDLVLHGGRNGLSNKVFSFDIEMYVDCVKVIFKSKIRDLEDGFPGDLDVKVIYTIWKDKTDLKVEHIAISDKNTVCSLTNHTYFNLGDDFSKLSLRMDARNFVSVSKRILLPLGRKDILPCLDFSKFKKLVMDIDNEYLTDSRTNGYDHHFYLSEENPKISLRNNQIQLDISTDYSGAQIYSDNYPDFKGRGTNKSFRRAVAIEPQESPLEEHPLKANEEYKKSILYHFKVI